jgi:hypothetical protein
MVYRHPSKWNPSKGLATLRFMHVEDTVCQKIENLNWSIAAI